MTHTISDHKVPNSKLVASKLPSASADWDEIARFALTFDGYKAFGGIERLTELHQERRSSTLSELRGRLFWKQRARRWNESVPEPGELTEIAGIMD